MRVSTTKECFELVRSAYRSPSERLPAAYPKWVRDIETTKLRSRAELLHLYLCSAAILLLLRSSNADRNLPKLEGPAESIPEGASRWAAISHLVESTKPRVVKSAFQSLSEIAESREYLGLELAAALELDSYDHLHDYVTNACERNAEVVTPVDVVRAMCGFSTGGVLHCYAHNGLGILYGAPKEQSAYLVGDEFRADVRLIQPSGQSEDVNENALALSPGSVVGRCFAELEEMTSRLKQDAHTLLVNAATERWPFLPKENETPSSKGTLNICLDAGYGQVIALVSNEFLTPGKITAGKILRYLMRKGLKKVVQLPKGLVGIRTKAHSILVFEAGQSIAEVEFIDLSKPANVQPASKAYGKARRAFEFREPFSLQDISGAAPRTTVDVNRYLSSLTEKKSRRIISFEAGQFLDRDPLSKLRNSFKFRRIADVMDVFRSHNLEQGLSQEKISFHEIGANSITENGLLNYEKVVSSSRESLQRNERQILQNGDLVLCFRGAEDAFGRVGIHWGISETPAMPNQSLLILRLKLNETKGCATPEYLLWWLLSDAAQSYMRNKAISHSVVRISPKDIKDMEFPYLPDALIPHELSRIQRAVDIRKAISVLQAEFKHLLSAAWTDIR